MVYSSFAVDFTFGTSLETTGPGASARIRYMERSSPIGRTASMKTSIPMPPTQCVKLRQNSTLIGRASISESIVAPVVVKPETVSKKQFIAPSIAPLR